MISRPRIDAIVDAARADARAADTEAFASIFIAVDWRREGGEADLGGEQAETRSTGGLGERDRNFKLVQDQLDVQV